MTLWLSLKFFGSGFGLRQPFWDGPFYWLVDTYREERNARNGRLYTWIGGLGAQLQSIEWRMPVPGTRRKLAGKEFTPFSAERNGLLVRVAWQAHPHVKDFEEVRALERELHRVA